MEAGMNKNYYWQIQLWCHDHWERSAHDWRKFSTRQAAREFLKEQNATSKGDDPRYRTVKVELPNDPN